MNNVSSNIDSKVSSDSAWSACRRLCSSNHCSGLSNNIISLPDHGNNGSWTNKVAKSSEEGSCWQICIVFLGMFSSHTHHFESDKLIPSLFPPFYNVSHKSSLHSIWFDHKECLLSFLVEVSAWVGEISAWDLNDVGTHPLPSPNALLYIFAQSKLRQKSSYKCVSCSVQINNFRRRDQVNLKFFGNSLVRCKIMFWHEHRIFALCCDDISRSWRIYFIKLSNKSCNFKEWFRRIAVSLSPSPCFIFISKHKICILHHL